MSRLIQVALVTAAALITSGGAFLVSPQEAPAQDAGSVAKQAQALFRARCFECHGENGIASKDVFVLDRERLIADKVVVPGDRGSLLVKMVETGAMPLSGDKLKPEEIAVIQKWVEAGAPAFDAPVAKARGVPVRGRAPARTSCATSPRSTRGRSSSSATSASRTSTTRASPTPSSWATAWASPSC